MCQVDLMDRLPCFTNGTRISLSLAISPSVWNPGFRYLIRCPPLGSQIVNSFCQRTLLYFTASVAYIWRFKAMGTYFFFIMLAVTVAYEFTLFTDSYQWMPAVICPTYFFPLTCFSVLAGIMRASITGVLFDGIVPDLLCDGSPVPSQFLSSSVKVMCSFSPLSISSRSS